MKKRILIGLVVLVSMLASLVPVASADGGNSPAQLVASGWTCYPREGMYVFCMVPYWKTPNLLPAAIVNKVFLTQDITSTDAPFVGTTTYLREDLYASQPCASSDLTEWVFVRFGGSGQFHYYYCRHPVP